MRLIDADALDDSLGIEDRDIYVKRCLEEAPTVDAAPVVHGRWEIVETYGKTALYRCTACKTEMVDSIGREDRHRYCHMCGVLMDLPEGEEARDDGK